MAHDNRYGTSRQGTALALALALAFPGAGHGAGGRAPSPGLPGDTPAMEKVIDATFIRWGQNWWMDRYIPDSAIIGESQAAVDGRRLVRGTFRFQRGGAVHEIVFSSALAPIMTAPATVGGWAVANLCYNDTTSGLTDCTASGGNAGAVAFMGAIIAVGVLAAMAASGGGTDDDRERAILQREDEMRYERAREQERRQDEANRARELEQQLDRQNRSMYNLNE